MFIIKNFQKHIDNKDTLLYNAYNTHSYPMYKYKRRY